jgi:hypothetical protein
MNTDDREYKRLEVETRELMLEFIKYAALPGMGLGY